VAYRRIQGSERNVVRKFGDGNVKDAKELSDRNDVTVNSCGIVLRVSVSLTFQHLLPVSQQMVLRSLEGEKTCHWAGLRWFIWLGVEKVGKPKGRVRSGYGNGRAVSVSDVWSVVCREILRKGVNSDKDIRIAGSRHDV
jgi:hypothetical protein